MVDFIKCLLQVSFDFSHLQGINGGVVLYQLGDIKRFNEDDVLFFYQFHKDTFAMEVDKGKKYLLRNANTALNDELFFAAGMCRLIMSTRSPLQPLLY
ncbi:Cupredoxin [Artemisia annua]|uniref:Cupredoxin n=1 Tax=Artemisia annua TaxID=35608 RepID=A0A2U1KWY7_ARTAN|nr:Cupredoxin [Artemisia annua]